MRKLGKGLSELGLNELLKGTHHPDVHRSLTALYHLPLNQVFPGQYQPRKQMGQEELMELAESIRVHGIIQPIIVRPTVDHRYEIIAGERRWRAAQMIGLKEIPAITRQVSDQTAMAFALIENIQRRDLNAIEEAQALQRLLQEFDLTHEAVAEAVGKSRAGVSNLLRLLQLNDEVKNLLVTGQIQMGHARALLGLTGDVQRNLAHQVVAKDLSVRQTEALVRGTSKLSNIRQNVAPVQLEEDIALMQNQLSEKLGAHVSIRHNSKGRGKIVINYQNLEKLAGILSLIQ